MRRTHLAAAWLLGLALALPAAAQEHAHTPPAADPDPLLRVMLEGPHLVLAHHGFILLTGAQLDALREARGRVCAAEVDYVHARTRAHATLAHLLEDDADETRTAAAVEALARAEAAWTRALIRARQETRAALGPAERAQVAWLGTHWAQEARAMIDATTHAGHRGHPGLQVPIRVPGMVVADTALAPACDALHGPAVHLSVPPPGER
ncbi:MAG: hypothetical protein Q8L86_19635 [Vicinamibacterales bacterium]|nr:hypothetical protein [Vicinamibacterales bacterium]